MELIPLIIYLILLFYIGFKARRRGAGQDEFLLGSRSLSLPAFIATLVSTWYGGILGVGEFVYTRGLSAWFVLGLPYYLFALLFAWILAPRIRSAENYSIPDMLYRVYDRSTGLLGSLFIMIMTSPAPYILMIGILIQHLFPISFFYSILLGTLFSVGYVFWGGFRSVVQTDIIQFALMFLGFMVLFLYLTEYAFPLTELSPRLSAGHKSISGGLHQQQWVVWFLIASWTFIDPGFHQRCAAARTPGIARKGIILSVAFWFVFDMLTLTTGLYAVVLLPDIDPLMAYPLLAEEVLPPLLKGLFLTGLLATIMSTVDSFTFLSAQTFGHDLVWRLLRQREKRSVTTLVRWGLMITAVLSIALIMYMPSVIKLWYHLGSLFIPPLLIPLLAAYFPGWRIPAKATFSVMLLSFLTALSFYVWGEFHLLDGQAQYPLNLEPFFPGLFVSIIGYALAKLMVKGQGNKDG